MELIALRCNHCGAPLEVGPQARFVTCQFCKNQLEVKHTGSAAYTEVVQQIAENTREMASNLQVIELQNELERVDREWELENSRQGASGKDTKTSVPAVAAGLVILLMVGAFGFFFATTTSSLGAPAIFPLFGIGFVAVAIFAAVSLVTRASSFSEAQSSYQKRRTALLSRIEAARSERE